MRLWHFADFAAVFQERFMKPLWERYPQRESGHWDSLGLFLEGYAFERQGRRPDYAPAAVDAIQEVKTQGISVETGDAHGTLWACFKQRLKQLGEEKLNEANNPLAPKGTTFLRSGSPRATNSLSIIEFVVRRISDAGFPSNILVFAKAGLECDQLEAAHNGIQEINGIGPKIASLFLRDVATFYNIFPSKDRHLLQPIDVWVRRIVNELGGPANDQDTKKWIVHESATASVNPEAVNQGMWYFATEIAGSYYRLRESIHDSKRAEVLFAQHKQALNGAAQAATLIRIQP